jgi:PAS domain S-box-containing protein
MRVERVPAQFSSRSTQAIADLSRIQQLLAEAQALALIGSWEWDLLTGLVTWSEEHYRIFGIAPGTPMTYELASSRIHPADQPRTQHLIQQSLADGQPYRFEFRIVLPDGTERWIEARGRAERDASGRPVRKIGTSQDITERVRASERLQRAEAEHRDLVEHAVEGVFRTTPAGRFLMANQALATMLGYETPAQLLAERTDLAHQHYVLPAERERFQRLLEANDVIRGFEYEAYRRDGTTVWLRAHVRLVREPDGTACYYEGTVEDITERKQAERLLDLRARQQAAVARLGEAAVSGEAIPTLIQCAAALVGDTLDVEFAAVFELRPDGDLLLRAGIGWRAGAVPLVLDDWRSGPHATPPHLAQTGIRSGITVIIGPTDRPYGVLAAHSAEHRGFTVDDVNFLHGIAAILAAAIVRQRGDEVRAHLLARAISAQEEERTRIARELHDETGQALAVILLGLGNLEHADTLEEAHKLTHRLRDVTTQTVRDVGRLARGLRPATLDELGLLSALQRYGEELGASHHLAVRISGDRLARFPADVETTLYRIVQEALTNVARHARACSAEVSIRRESGVVHVTVRDDGAGFDVSSVLELSASRRSLGLMGMRERASLLGGSLVISSQPGEGTSIAIELPVNGTA